MADSGAFSGPRDAAVMESILKEMGVEEYDPNVVNQMLEFSYRYVTNVLEDARVYSEHAQKKELDISDVKLAVQAKMDHSFTTPPPRDFLMELAKKKNSVALPLIPEKFGPRLPPERYCLTANNYKMLERKKTSSVSKPQVTLSATFRIPGKQTTTSPPNTASTPTARTQFTSPLATITSPSITKSAAQPTLLAHLTQGSLQELNSGGGAQQHGGTAGLSLVDGKNANSGISGVDSILGKRKA